MRTFRAISLAGLLIFLFAATAQADNLFGEFKRVPDDIERGFYVGGDFGLNFFTGNKRSAQNPGFQLSFTTGYDFWKYVSVEGIYILGLHEASPVDLGGGVNTFTIAMAVKGELPLGRFHPFFEVGPGFHYSNPEFFPGQNLKLAIVFGGGFEYYTYLRHYSLYLKALYSYIDLPIDALSIAAGIKYTF